MKYISIGIACAVKYNINKYKGESESLFFDWLMTSMSSVNEIFSCDNIDNILNVNNIIKDTKDPTHGNCSRINFKSLDFCVSIHDVPAKYDNNDILNFIDKYKRRFLRIIDFIKSNEKICFIRQGFASDHETNNFIAAILKINPNCNFTLVVIHNDKQNKDYFLKKQNHLLYFYLNIPANNSDWTQEFLDWKKIFSEIENNT